MNNDTPMQSPSKLLIDDVSHVSWSRMILLEAVEAAKSVSNIDLIYSVDLVIPLIPKFHIHTTEVTECFAY